MAWDAGFEACLDLGNLGIGGLEAIEPNPIWLASQSAVKNGTGSAS